MKPEKYVGIVDDTGVDMLLKLQEANMFVLDMRMRFNTPRNPKLWAGFLSEEEIKTAFTMPGQEAIIFIENASRRNQPRKLETPILDF